MDPSIMKLLEDDEDESMHSGADVEAFTAALNRDIGRDDADISPPPESITGILPQQGSSSTSSQLLGQWQTSTQEVNTIQPSQQQDEQHCLQFQEQHSSQMGQLKQQSGIENVLQENGSQPGQSQIIPLQEQSQTERPQPQQQPTEPDNLKFVEKKQVQSTEQTPAQTQEENRVQHSENQPKHPTPQSNNQQEQTSDQSNNAMRRMRLSSISFHALIPVLRPHLDKDRNMQLNNVFSKLKSNGISREDFLRVIRNIVGDKMLRQAAHKVMQAQALAARNSQTIQNQHQAQSQASSQQLPARSAPQFPEHQSFSQVNPASSIQHQNGMQNDNIDSGGQNSKVPGNPSDGQGMHASGNMINVKQERENSIISLQQVNKPQNHSQLPPSSFSMHGSTIGSFNTHAFPRPIVSDPATSLTSQARESQIRQIPLPQGVLSSQSGATRPINLTNASKSLPHYTGHSTLQENQIPWQPSANKEQRGSTSSSMVYVKQEIAEQAAESKQPPHLSTPQSCSFGAMDVDQVNPSSSSKDERIDKQPSRSAFFTSTMAAPQMTSSLAFSQDPTTQVRPQIPSTNPPVMAGTNAKTPPKKTSTGQKKPLEAQTTPSPVASKKQKVSGSIQDQSIEQLNDVTAVSGVNLREEEEQLLAAPKEESRASEATRRAVQEEEERLIVQKRPLQKKISEIMCKCGIENVSTDVERCLSMCVEERLRGLISNLIRLSKQRVDIEKTRHRIVFTSDVRRQVMAKAKEDWDRKRAEEAEKLRKLNESEGNIAGDAEKDKDEGRSKTPKPNKEEDDKMRTTAANVAARAAVGGDDMLSKWQLMAEQARQKREGGADGTSGPQPGKAVGRKALLGKASRDSQEGDNKSGTAAASGTMRKFGRSPVIIPHQKVARSISAKDVIAVLEREPQMSKSALIYRLYERISGDLVVEV